MRLNLDSLDGSIPKRGDILQTNVGDRRERTCLILGVRRMRRPGRFNVWAERWWQIEPILRWRLYLSAERNGGQQVIYFRRYKPRPKKRNSPLDIAPMRSVDFRHRISTWE